jgi:hypothetical protein
VFRHRRPNPRTYVGARGKSNENIGKFLTISGRSAARRKFVRVMCSDVVPVGGVPERWLRRCYTTMLTHRHTTIREAGCPAACRHCRTVLRYLARIKSCAFLFSGFAKVTESCLSAPFVWTQPRSGSEGAGCSGREGAWRDT